MRAACERTASAELATSETPRLQAGRFVVFESPVQHQRKVPPKSAEAEVVERHHLYWLRCLDAGVQRLVAKDADAVQWLVCLSKENVRIGTYAPSGDPAYRVDLNARVLLWPSGNPVAGKYLRGSEKVLVAPYDDLLEYLNLSRTGGK